MTLPAAAFPLRVTGARILGADGSTVRLGGVNWGGAQQDEGVPGGLDVLPRSTIIGRIIAAGFNHVRLPYATGAFVSPSGTARLNAVPAGRLAANPDLVGLTAWSVYQQLVDDMTQAGLYVIINQCLFTPGWCCSNADNNGLWYNDVWPTTTFIFCWRMIATRFAANPMVGYDIHNEPRAAMIGGKPVTPTWGDGNAYTDIRHMQEDMTDKLRAIDPDALVFCEGLSFGTDLSRWGFAPIRRTGAVASVHDYANDHPAGQTQAAYETQMDARIGYLVTNGQAPAWIGEFGANTDAATAVQESGWLPQFITWAAKRGVSWCWWELGATMVLGTEPTTNALKAPPGRREAFGLFSGQDWKGTQATLLAMLKPIMP
jgi:endoglucanase